MLCGSSNEASVSGGLRNIPFKNEILELLQTSFIFAIFPLIDRSDEKKIERELFNTPPPFIKIFQLHSLIFFNPFTLTILL